MLEFKGQKNTTRMPKQDLEVDPLVRPYRLVIHKSVNKSYKCCSKVVNNINTGTAFIFHEWSECNANNSEQIIKFRSIHTSRAKAAIQTEVSTSEARTYSKNISFNSHCVFCSMLVTLIQQKRKIYKALNQIHV